eukprot:CAMPEP_0171019310 /NCGR_PEP_ID=MMETSP0736-20130129/28995_1 /TAXON_ID=186038 /ORGANISM="Fragilariopsis kerguelensis, Strain L26-C5" /LENGTH=77 /DNA_ID=CAMNT_0011456399 /DNA_START=125 /DNA_END=354 /DNA_ORIENTATION=+
MILILPILISLMSTATVESFSNNSNSNSNNSNTNDNNIVGDGRRRLFTRSGSKKKQIEDEENAEEIDLENNNIEQLR